MAQTDFLSGLILGAMVRVRHPPDPLRMGIGIGILAAIFVVGIFLCRDLGNEKINDTSKALWALGFFLLPAISWIGYYFVVKKGTSITKISK